MKKQLVEQQEEEQQEEDQLEEQELGGVELELQIMFDAIWHRILLLMVVVALCTAVIVLVLTAVFGKDSEDLAQGSPNQAQSNNSFGSGGIYDENTVRVEVPLYTKEIYLVSSSVISFMQSEKPASLSKGLSSGDKRLDVGLPVQLTFDVTHLPEGIKVQSSKVEISETADFKTCRIFDLDDEARSVSVRHLKTGTKYYYRIQIALSNSAVASMQGTFKTAQSPRILSIEGALNVRDIGGWKMVDGKTVRQGLLYRGTEIDGAVEKNYCITEKGREDMLDVLKIRTDMDLRPSSDNKLGTHALGEKVTHTYYDAPMYSGIFKSPEKVCRIFRDLADAEKYPIYFHCTYGMDRTGTFCYLLEALLGVDEKDLARDYQMTCLCFSTHNTNYMEAFVDQLKQYEGDTMQKKVENYLLSVGVSEDEIANIRQIFLGE